MNTVNTRKKFFPNVTDEEWNDWTWQVKNRIEAQRSNPLCFIFPQKTV